MDDPYRRVLRALADHGSQVVERGSVASAQCPAAGHDDRNASLSVSRGDRQPVVITCHRGCTSDDILGAVGLSWGDLCTPREERGADTWMPCGHAKVAEYEYRDQYDALVFAVARCAEKGKSCQGFRQWRPDSTSASGKRWSRNLPDGTRVGDGLPYRLPDVLASSAMRNVWIVEGEKDCDRLWSLGVPAACNAQGAGRWTPAHAGWLAGRDVIVVADQDKPGWAHAGLVAASLLGVARSVEVVRAASGKDISEHLDAGHRLSAVVTVSVAKEAPAIGPDGSDLPEGGR